MSETTNLQLFRKNIKSLMDAIGSAAIHQEEFQLVMKRLTNIAKILNTQESSIDDDAMKRVLPNLEITIKALRICLEEDHKFEISSTNKSQKLKYDQRHIQTVLFDALERLLSHEADLIKDPEPRAKLLSEGYFEQQMLRRKIFEKELKLREEAAKVDASKTCKELLFQLHQEHGYIITSYLEQCLILHGTVPVAGLDAAVVGNVVARFYGVTPAQQGAFEQNWRSFQMPLEHCSIQVRADQSTSFERKAARQMLMDDKLDLFFNFKHKHSQGGTWVRRLLNAPYMPTMVKRDRFQLEDKGDSFEISDVLRKHRWIVILGDPGSGKTTFVRWLMLQYAQAFRDGQDELIFGFTRMPILIRIGEFAEALAENNSLTLFDYIGHHKWFGKPVLPPNMINSSTAGQISRALQDYVKKGQALIILDGLDEIPASEQRSALVNLVEKFVDEHVKTPLFGSALDNLHAMHLNDNPSQSGGNQLLITSRIVGYHAAPVTGHFSHFIIKHMDQDSMKAFVDFWFHAVHMKIIDLLKLIDSQIPAGEYTWIRHARMLKTELDNNDNVGLLELASNALLITVICGIAFGSKEMSLPKQRILLYSETVNSMLLAWNNKGSSINEGKLVSILGDIAEHIHQNSSSGLIEEEDLKKICALSIRSYENMQNPTADDLKRFDNEALQFAQIIRDDVGILAARGESMYGFLHLTFQEYFASLNLTNKQKLKHKSNSAGLTDVQLIAQSLHQHIYDPRFRVILSLAFGKLSLNQKKGYFDSICSAFLSESRAANFFVPLAPLLLISCGNDLSQPLSSDVLFDVLDLLLVAAGRDNWYSTSPNLFTQLLKSVDKLPDASVTDFIHRFLSQHLSQKSETVRALCRLIRCKIENDRNFGWIDFSVFELLLQLSSKRDKNDNFEIDTLLSKIAFENHDFLSSPKGSLQFFLRQKEFELSTIHPSILAILIAVYGGLKRHDKTVIFDPRHIYRNSSLLTPLLIDYFIDTKTSQIEKLCRLETQCHDILSSSFLSEETSNTADTLMAILCISGVEKLWTYHHLLQSKIFAFTLSRLKHVAFIIHQCFTKCKIEDATKKIICECMKIYGLLDYAGDSEIHSGDFLRMTEATVKGFARLSSDPTFSLPKSLKSEECLQRLLSRDMTLPSKQQSCSHLPQFVSLFWILEDDEETDTQYRMAVASDTIPAILMYHNDKDPMYALSFVPKHLRALFTRLLQQQGIIINDNQLFPNTLSFRHILIECLMTLSSSTCKRLSLLYALCGLLPLLRVYKLENLAVSLLWTLSTSDADWLVDFDYTRQRPMDADTHQYTDDVIELRNPPDDFPQSTLEQIIKRSQEEEQTRLQDALALVKQSPHDEKGNVNLYSASVSLVYICWYAREVDPISLLREAIEAALCIQLPLLRFDALCAIACHPRVHPDLLQFKNRRTLRDELEQQLVKIQANLTPLLHTTIIVRCFPILRKVPNMDSFVQDLLTKLNSQNSRISYSDRQAIYAALSKISYESQHVHSHLHKFMEESDLREGGASQSFLSLQSNSFLNYFMQSSKHELSLSEISLLSAMYLAQLTNDCHQIATWSALTFTQSSPNLFLHEKQKILNVTDKTILTYAQAFTTERLCHFYASQEDERKALVNLSTSLHSVMSVENNALPVIAQWLNFENHPFFKFLSWHAALLHLQLNLWSSKATMIVSKLLCNDHDRFRQRADSLIEAFGDDQIRTSTQLGLDAVLVLLGRYSWSCHNSSYCEIILLRRLFKVSIDQVNHLQTILQLERYRVAIVNNRAQQDMIIGHQQLGNAWTLVMNSGYIDVSLCVSLERLSPQLFPYVADLLKSDFSELPPIGTSNGKISKEDHQTFVVNVLIALGISLISKNIDGTILVEAIADVIKKTVSNEIQQAAVYALSFSRMRKKTLLDVIQTATKSENNAGAEYSEEVLCTAIRGYFHYISEFEESFDDDENRNIFLELLEHSSPNIVQATRLALARAVDDTDHLLTLMKSDDVECYRALIAATADIFNTEKSKKLVETSASFIVQHPDLLPLFVSDLYQNIHHFSDQIVHESSALYKYEYQRPLYVPMAAALVEHIPAAFCAYVNECGYGEKLKRALYYTSKQQRFFRRAACLTILSAFGELTTDLCEMLLQGLLDEQYVQNTCYRCLGRIQSVKDQQVIGKLFMYLKSVSMNTRYVVSKLLIRLTQLAIIPLAKTQEALTEVIADPTSSEELWLIEEQEEKYAKNIYNNVGRLKDAVYNLLVKHLISDADNNVPSKTPMTVDADLTEEDIDFINSEKAVRLAACLFEKELEEEHSGNTLDDNDSETSNELHTTDEWKLSINKEDDDDQLLNYDDYQLLNYDDVVGRYIRDGENSETEKPQRPTRHDDVQKVNQTQMTSETDLEMARSGAITNSSSVATQNRIITHSSACCIVL